MRVVVTRIEHDGGMHRRVIDTVAQHDPRSWEDLAARAVARAPPYRPVPGAMIYHVCVGDLVIQVGEDDLHGPLRDLVTVVLAMGSEPLGSAGSRPRRADGWRPRAPRGGRA